MRFNGAGSNIRFADFANHEESTTQLVAALWSLVPGSPTNATGSPATFTDTNTLGAVQWFYRVVSP